MNTHVHKLVYLMVLLLSACASQTLTPSPPPSTVPQVPEPTPSSSPTAVPTPVEARVSESALVPMPGGYVYGDPGGRFSLPLIGEWSLVETDGSYGRFMLADPPLELNAVIVGTDDLEEGVNEALVKIGVAPSALSLLSDERIEELIVIANEYIPGWSVSIYSLEGGQGVTVAAQVMDGETAALIVTGEVGNVTSLGALGQVEPSFTYFSLVPLTEFLEECDQDSPPTSVEAIERLTYIEFCSGGQKLVGSLFLPEGEGPFPAIVYAGGGSGRYTRESNPFNLVTAGFAVFTYDKRGLGDSEGFFMGLNDPDARTSEWRVPQLAEDALAAVAFLQNLQEINPDQIGLMGGSLDGYTVPMAASKSDALAFTVIIVGPTVPVGDNENRREILDPDENSRRTPEMSQSELEELQDQLADFDGPHGFDPRASLEAMTMPGLWIMGGRDAWVATQESMDILESISEEYGKDFTILFYPNEGHSIQGSRFYSEMIDWIYAQLEE